MVAFAQKEWSRLLKKNCHVCLKRMVAFAPKELSRLSKMNCRVLSWTSNVTILFGVVTEAPIGGCAILFSAVRFFLRLCDSLCGCAILFAGVRFFFGPRDL
jgi:hypothetical protein